MWCGNYRRLSHQLYLSDFQSSVAPLASANHEKMPALEKQLETGRKKPSLTRASEAGLSARINARPH